MRKVVIVDIDGTLSIVGDRVKHLSEKPCNWDEFYKRCGEDTVNSNVAALVAVLMYSKDYDIVYMTGRRESERDATVMWLQNYCIHSAMMFMRKNGDFRHDTEVKPEFMEELFRITGAKKEDIAFILEDRNSMVKKWRELGYTCLQVAEGDF